MRPRPEPPGFVHVFRWTRFLGYLCVMCKAQADMIQLYDFDHYNDCPGWVEPARSREPAYEQETLW